MNRISGLLLLLCSVSSACLAQVDEEELASCAAVDNDIARLQCFDELTTGIGQTDDGAPAEAAPPPPPEEPEGWQVTTTVNPVDDSTTVRVLLKSHIGMNNFDEKIELGIQCLSGETQVYLDWNEFLGEQADILTRLGNEPAETGIWDLSTDSLASFHPDPLLFIDSLMQVERLVVQTTPFGEKQVTAIFNLTGIHDAVRPLREVCNW